MYLNFQTRHDTYNFFSLCSLQDSTVLSVNLLANVRFGISSPFGDKQARILLRLDLVFFPMVCWGVMSSGSLLSAGQNNCQVLYLGFWRKLYLFKGQRLILGRSFPLSITYQCKLEGYKVFPLCSWICAAHFLSQLL